MTGRIKIQRNLDKVKGESSIQNTEVDRCAPNPIRDFEQDVADEPLHWKQGGSVVRRAESPGSG